MVKITPDLYIDLKRKGQSLLKSFDEVKTLGIKSNYLVYGSI